MTTPTAAAEPRLRPNAGLSRAMVALFAVAAGFAVANIYYCQPLLTAIADTFDVSSACRRCPPPRSRWAC